MRKNDKEQLEAVKKTIISPLAFKNELNKLSKEDLFIKISSLDREDREKAWSVLSDKKCAEILEASGTPLEWFQEMSTKKESSVISIMDEEKATALLSLLDKDKRIMILELSGREFQKRLRYSSDGSGLHYV